MAHQPTIRADTTRLPGSSPGLAATSAWEELLATLGAAGGSDASIDIALDLILHEVVVQALPATGASGGAIALSRNNEMVCRATSGETAPALGARLSLNSGLSGECVRSGLIQRCDDTEFDPRVDAQVCRELGIRSFVVTPLLSQGRVVGVFEILSQHSWTFDDRAVAALEGLGRWAVSALEEAARSKERPYQTLPPTPAETHPVGEVSALQQAEQQTISQPALRQPSSEESSEHSAPGQAVEAEALLHAPRPRRDLVTTVLGIGIVVVALILGWVLGMSSWQKAWMKYQQGVLQAKSSTPPPRNTPVNKKVETAGTAAPEASPQPPVPVEKTAVSPRPAVSQPDGLVVYESGKVVFRETPRKAPVQAAGRERISPVPGQANSQTKSGPEVGTVGFAGDAQTGAHPVPGSAVTPAPSGSPTSQEEPAGPNVRVSQITGGHLLQRVPPVYPPRAKELHLQGRVMLEARVSRDGKILEVRVLSGDAMLAEAAIAAVRQWEYEPFMLNGEPVEMPTRITVNFTYP